MYRAFAPFFMGVRGDRRVTGMAPGERGRLGGIWERLQKKEMGFLLKEIRIMGIIGWRACVVGKIILIILISFSNLLWVFLSTTGGFFFFITVMGDRRMTVKMKTAHYSIEFSREFNAVSTRWDDYVPLRRQILSRIHSPSALWPFVAWSCHPSRATFPMMPPRRPRSPCAILSYPEKR